MPLHSMTGYARDAGAHGGVRWTWELRSVNGRGLELRLRLPPGFDALEMKVRAAAQARLKRGNVQVSLAIVRERESGRIRINTEALRQILSAMEELEEIIEAEEPRLDGILGLKGVIETVEEEEDAAARGALETALLAGLDHALEALLAMRAREGESLRGVLARTLDEIARCTGAAAGHAEAAPGRIRDRLAEQIRQLLDAAPGFAPERLAQEAALLATRADIREEIDRLSAHVDQARELIAGGEAAGRKLDFLAQEFMREANTLCAKASDISLTRLGIELKALVDQFREQVQNVE